MIKTKPQFGSKIPFLLCLYIARKYSKNEFPTPEAYYESLTMDDLNRFVLEIKTEININLCELNDFLDNQ